MDCKTVPMVGYYYAFIVKGSKTVLLYNRVIYHTVTAIYFYCQHHVQFACDIISDRVRFK